MWNRRKDEEYAPPPRPVTTPPSSADLTKEGIPMSTMPGRISDPHSHADVPRSGIAVLGKSVMVKGQIYSREDLTIDGEVEGTVELQEHRLTVGPNGKVQASVKAREIVVLGTIHGNVEATDKIDIRKDAKLVGDIKTARIVIEDGAYFKGSIDIARPDVAKTPPPKPHPAPAVAAAPQPAPLAAGAGDSKR
jgi:cytoskeletal protein CcmA (bactofilin family)